MKRISIRTQPQPQANPTAYRRTALEGLDGKHGGYRKVWSPRLGGKEQFDRSVAAAILVVRRQVAHDTHWIATISMQIRVELNEASCVFLYNARIVTFRF